MAITEELLKRCQHCCKEAQQTLIALSEGRFLDPSAVTIRRRAANISADASFSLLRRAFITALDREDVWQLRHRAEQLWRECENTALRVQYAKERCCSSDILHKVETCCGAVHTALERFPHPFDTTAVYGTIEDAQHRLLRETPSTLTEGLYRITFTCEELLFWLQYTMLKNG